MLLWTAVLAGIRGTFVFSGRSERLEQWAFAFFTSWIVVAVYIIHGRFIPIHQPPMNYIVLILGIWLIVANTALMVRRLHDHGLSGFYLFIPLLGIFVMLLGLQQAELEAPFMGALTTKFVILAGRALTFMSMLAFLAYFAREGMRKSNQFGEPV